MKRQEIFDLAVAHAKTMKKPCNRGWGCAYRGSYGQMCLIGAMIKDEYYSEKLEHKTVENSEVIKALHKSGILSRSNIPSSTENFLFELQQCHDRNDNSEDFPGDLKQSLKNFSEEHNLEFNW